MADWTPLEYKKLLGFKDHVRKQQNKTQDVNQKMKMHMETKVTDADDAIDWRTNGAVTPVKD